MGLDLNTAMILHDWIERYAITGPFLTLGVQQLNFTWEQFVDISARRLHGDRDRFRRATADELLGACGIGETFSLDISGHEGADFLVDLNDAVPPRHLVSRFAAVLNGGTIEHVFNIPNALSAITRMLRLGGIVIHMAPVHNWIDHGFYQINPTLLFDYYTAARFEILESIGLVFAEGNFDRCDIVPVPPGAFGSGQNAAFGNQVVLCMFAARKTSRSLEEAIPTQSIYAREPVHPPPTLRWCPPCSAVNGIRTERECIRWKLVSYHREEGLAWVAALPEEIAEGDTIDAPGRSRLTLFEDDRLLGPGHALHALIRAHGGGSYSHWNRSLLFSSSDGSDPNRNGRSYIAVISQSV